MVTKPTMKRSVGNLLDQPLVRSPRPRFFLVRLVNLEMPARLASQKMLARLASQEMLLCQAAKKCLVPSVDR